MPADADVLAAALEELHQHQQSVHFQAVLAQEAAKAARSTWSVSCSSKMFDRLSCSGRGHDEQSWWSHCEGSDGPG